MGPLVIGKNADFGERKFYQHSVVGRLWLVVGRKPGHAATLATKRGEFLFGGGWWGRTKGERQTTNDALGFCLGFQLDVAVGEFDRIFDVLAVILLADFFGLFLHEIRERVEVA